jgi:hypothetical protein
VNEDMSWRIKDAIDLLDGCDVLLSKRSAHVIAAVIEDLAQARSDLRSELEAIQRQLSAVLGEGDGK